MLVLGIETSCDETGIAIYSLEEGLLANTLYSQADKHAKYGGVVPELASRDHLNKIMPLIEQTLVQAEVKKNQLDGIAYTAGPGLHGALLVGASWARGLGYALNVPTLGVHHMEGHLLAPMLDEPKPNYPFLALLVSGGHTMLVDVQALGEYKILGQSLDDAVGEAFDKTAKLLGLGYPGGPALAKLADQGQVRYKFTRPMTNKPGLDFSFSGLKTQVLRTVHSLPNLAMPQQADIAASFQKAVVDTLLIKSKRAVEEVNAAQLVIAGGVSANSFLRQQFTQWASQAGIELFFPRLPFCTDNGAMIAYAGAQRLAAGQVDKSLEIQVQARWSLSDLSSIEGC